MNQKNARILCIASSGGHWEELMCLKKMTEEYSSVYVTEQGGQAQDCELEHIYTVPQINRHEKHFLFHFLKIFRSARKIIKKERPKVIVTTGALIAFPFCLIGKLHRVKIVYIESFARVYERSLTGKLVYPFADLFLVQWETLLKVYPKAKYVGGIF